MLILRLNKHTFFFSLHWLISIAAHKFPESQWYYLGCYSELSIEKHAHKQQIDFTALVLQQHWESQSICTANNLQIKVCKKVRQSDKTYFSAIYQKVKTNHIEVSKHFRRMLKAQRQSKQHVAVLNASAYPSRLDSPWEYPTPFHC